MNYVLYVILFEMFSIVIGTIVEVMDFVKQSVFVLFHHRFEIYFKNGELQILFLHNSS